MGIHAHARSLSAILGGATKRLRGIDVRDALEIKLGPDWPTAMTDGVATTPVGF